jgi:hypothetical protein
MDFTRLKDGRILGYASRGLEKKEKEKTRIVMKAVIEMWLLL